MGFVIRFVASLFLLCCVACVSALPPAREASAAQNYGRNRAMDARDVVGATFVAGRPAAGVKAYVGPVGVGVFFAPNPPSRSLIPIGTEELGLKNGEFGAHFLEDHTLILTVHETMEGSNRAQLRGKNTDELLNDNPAYYMRLGIAASCLMGLRLEVNPGELLDLMLGFFTIDIFGDDIYGKKIPSQSAMKD